MSNAKSGSIFRYFALLNLLFLGLQLLYFGVLSVHFVHAIPVPKFVYLAILGQVILQVILYLILTLIQTSWLWGLHKQWLSLSSPSKPPHLKRWLLMIFVTSAVFILTMNCYFFPLSQLGNLLLLRVPTMTINILLILSSLILIALTLNTLRALYELHFKKLIWGLMTAGLGVFLFIAQYPSVETKFSNPDNPNIILIGIDSLSPQYVNPQNTPTLEQFLQKSIRFTETISPLARTYPAWASILTGLYPLHHHARENLTPRQLVKAEASIAWRLRELGYNTLFATDDRRFNNLSQEFGFQKIIGPEIGVHEILLGSFYDFPLSNLFINSPIGRWLFPYNYINRASHTVYYPATFNHAVNTAINEETGLKPLLLAVHFTLPHWPYAWATSSRAQIGNPFNMKENKIALYTAALRAVDQQVSVLLTQLAQHHILHNSLVIVLSDHGEALYQKGSRIIKLKNYQNTDPSPLSTYFKHKTSTALERSSGHGSDLLSPIQFHCLLGIKIFQNGKQITTSKTITTRVALIDIAPTIYAFLNLPSPHEKRHFDGISLLPAILGKTTPLIQRAFMLESGLLPNQLIAMKEAMFYARLLYQVNQDNNLLEIRPDQLNNVNKMKLYGILENNWLLVLYPNDKHYLTVLVQLNNHQWTDQPNSPFAKKSPLKKLLKKLRAFYKVDLKDYPKLDYVSRARNNDSNFSL